MRNAFYGLAIAATAALSVASAAQAQEYYAAGPNPNVTAGEFVAGAAVGTGVGIAVSEGAFTGSLGAALPAGAVGAGAIGGVAGVATIVGLDAVLQPCRGFRALFDLNRANCVNGEYVGNLPIRQRVAERTVMRRHYYR